MASNMHLFPRMLKMLRENSSIKEKREALTYIRSNSKKLTSTGIVKEEQCKELCKLVVDAFASGNNDIQNEAYETLNVIIQDFKQHTLNLFEAMLQINQKNRLKILKLLEIIEDNAISTIAYDVHAIQCFTDCMSSVQANKMPWIAPTACVDNLQALMDAENKTLSDDQRLEEETVNYCIIFLRRLYKLAAATSDINIEKFDALLLDKVMLLAYMGHKRQRGPALKLLQQALATNILSHVRSKLTSTWTRYKSALQTIYCKRMLLLVSACELDWAAQWNISVQYLGVDLHKGAGLINDLLSIEEKAFKSTDTITRRQAFLSWKLLVDNFALDPQELATARRIKLLCIPLNAKNSKTELIAITKLEVWWHVIIKLYKDISRFVNPVLIQFLNFCFGPLGDTPLLSSKCEVIASPGKRFYKTKIIAVDALCQLLVTKHENHVFSPILEERLPHSMTDVVFQQCYKSVIHSVGEALLILSQLTDAEMKNRYQLSKILWTNLINYVQESKMENKENMHKDVILVTTELANYVETKPMIKQLVVDLILFEIANLSKEFNFQEDILSSLMFKLLKTSILNQAKKNHYNALKSLLWQCIKSSKDNTYYTYAFNCIKEMYNKLYTLSNVQNKNESVILELWLILTEVLMTYMDDIQEINEGSGEQHDLRTVESIVMFPFMYMCLQDQKQIQEITKTWKRLCTHLEMRADLIESIKTNEILMNIAKTMQHCLTKNKKSYHLIISCLDILLGSIDYKLLLTYKEVPPIMSLIVDLIIYFLCNNLVKECDSALKALSAVVITIYGHNPKKVISYLQVCKPAVELMLTYELSALYSEIASTWESIVSVLKGLGILIDANLISSYKKAIVEAVNHSNCEIQEQAMSLFELKNVIANSATLILEEIEKEMNEKKRNETNVHTEKLLNQDKTVDNFLKESNISKRIPKQTDDYVFIKTDLKFDVCRLTEHQKESLKRKREDIPALYNDLSQSSSQDTQNLQEWFDRKNKVSEEVEKMHRKNVMDDDADKENKVESEAGNKSVVESDTKTAENIEDNVSSETIKQINDNVDNTEDSLPKNEIIIPNCEHSEVEVSMNCTAEDLNFSIPKESSMSTDDVQRLSPSILNSGKRYDRSSISTRSCISQKLEVVTSQSEPTSNPQTLQKKLKTEVVQCISDTDNTNSSNDTKNKIFKDDKKGIKRKSASDSESDGSSLRQRRKTSSLEINSDTDSCKSTKSDTTEMCLEEIIDNENLSQRTRNEISRLRINMVFDSPLSDSRRSYKKHKDKKCDKKIVSEIKTVRGRGRPRTKRLEENNKFNKTEGKEKILKNKKYKVEEDKMKEDMNKDKDERVDIANSSTSSTKHDLLDAEVSSEFETVVSNEYLSDNGLEIVNDETNETFVEINNENIVNNQDNRCTEEKIQTQDDTDDIIESSQNISRLENKCNEKQCTIKVNNIEKVICMGEDENINLTVSNNCNSNNIDISENNNKKFEKTNKVSINESNISTPVTEKNSGSNEKTDPIEAQKKDVETPLNSVEFASPKSNLRNQSKFKSYSTQGRAAHMLGLVTKQARIEAGCQIIAMNDELVIKKARSKDTDPETLVKKERVSTCSSRQEKIFNNMKSSDYSSSPIKLFSNLKNDGEKFVKADNSVESIQIDVQDIKVDKTTAEIDEMPLLGWPSANSPSLNASPSVSILKRQRQSIPEPDPESTTPNKRKRVSFADPPVSKEVGYEITSSDFTHKTNKLISRGMLGRKDSPLRLKQIRQKSINIDTDKVEKDEGADVMNVSDIDLQCEKENELLTKMAEELEYSENVTINTDVQASYNTTENELTNIVPVQINGCNQIKIDHLSGEFEITQGSIFSKYAESTSVNKIIQNKVIQHSEVLNNSNINSKNTDFNDSATQEDIFTGTDTKCNDKITETKADVNLYDAQNASIENNLLDSHRFNDTKESTINHSSEGHLNTENLEDTIDAENLTRLNSTANSDEIFCGNLIRTSTQTAENIQEQDTLPVTDSIFGSLPLSQDSQNTSEFHVKIPHPELLNSIYPIYSPLILCQEPIDSIVHHLTNPLWVRHLTAYFASRNLQTVGDLARLSEREINRIPVKGNSKVEFVKGVLKSFEKIYAAKEITSTANNLNDDSNGKISSVNISTPGCIEETTSQHQISQKVPASTHKKIVSHESIMQETTSSSVPIPHSNSLNVITTQMMSGPMPSMVINTSSQSLENYNFFAASGTSIGCSTKSVETCTSSNSISSTKSEGNKTTRSVAAQMALEDLLDEIDLNLVLESAVRRCTPERILLQYKNKMKHIPQVELEKETVRILGSENVKNCTEVTLKAACRACGVNKVLLRLPDIFSSDKQFFSKVLNAYKKKINVTDCLDVLDFSEVKNVVCKKCTSSELAEILSNKLKEEEQEGIREPMTELSSLNAMLKRMPMDLIISHTVANEELIPSRVVLDIALQNNSTSDIVQALECQSSSVMKDVFEKLLSSRFAMNYTERLNCKQDLLKLFKVISSKLSEQDLLQAFYESMSTKVTVNQEK